MLSREAIETFLAIQEKISTEPEKMANELNITFFPFEKDEVSSEVISFHNELKKAFKELNVNIVPYEESIVQIPYRKVVSRFFKVIFNNFLYFFEKTLSRQDIYRQYIEFAVLKNIFVRERIKPGISIVATGANKTGKLPIDRASSFTQTFIMVILDMPEGVSEDTDFETHFDTAMSLFAYHMSNIVLGVNKEKWLLYNFNASHPFFERNKDFKKNLLEALIPKIVAPIRPHKFQEFIVLKENFDPNDDYHRACAEDLVESGSLFEKTGLYPAGKKITNLPFRNGYYKWIGKIHLDNRNGMSYGFLARQLPATLSKIIPIEQAHKIFGHLLDEGKDYFWYEGNLYMVFEIFGSRYCMEVPEAWTLTQRSGSDKTNMDAEKDLVKMGIKNGKMYLQAPKTLRLNSNFKTSFDTKVILAHSLGNVICASILEFLRPGNKFSDAVKKEGLAIAHWHGYMHPLRLEKGWYVYGVHNPHVSCSSPQSAIYALEGKLNTFKQVLREEKEYLGDIHIEPHHGSNITHFSLKEMAAFFSKDSDIVTLGNKYLKQYK